LKRVMNVVSEDRSMEEPDSAPVTPLVSITPVSDIPKPAQSESARAKAWRALNNTETVTGRPRHIVDAALIGTCIAFLIAFLGMQPKAIDASLHTAIACWAWAFPFLAWGFLNASMVAKPEAGRLLQAVLLGNWIVEGIGQVLACIGIFFVILHFDSSATTTVWWAIGIAIIGAPVVSFIGLFIYAYFASKVEERARQPITASTATPSRASDQGPEKTGP